MIRSPAMSSFAAARPEFCSGCKLERKCAGGCKAAAEVCCGFAGELDPFMAAFAAEAKRP